MNYIYDFVLKNALLVLGFLIIVFGQMVINIPNFHLDASSDSLVLDGDSSHEYYEKIKENYGSDDYLVISYQPQDYLLDTNQLIHLSSFRDDLLKLKHVRTVTSILDVPLFRSPPIPLIDLANTRISIDAKNVDLKLAFKEFTSSPIYSNNLVSLDGKTTALIVTLGNKIIPDSSTDNQDTVNGNNIINQQDLDSDTKALVIESVRSVIGNYRDKSSIFLGGLPMITTDIIAYISSDLLVFSLAVIGIMTLILTFIFRQWRWVFLPIIISISAALMMTGLLAILNWKVTVISSNFFSLLLVMTLSVTIHLIVRYRELAQASPDTEYHQLIKSTLEQMFKPCLFTTLTTFVAFASLIISGIKPVIDFGWMMSIGVSLALVLSFIAFPAIMAILPKPNLNSFKTESSFTGGLAKFTEHHGGKLLLAMVVLIGFSVSGINKLTVENRFIDYFKESTEINQGLTLIDKELGGTIPLEIIFEDLAEDYWFDTDIQDEIHKLHLHLESLPETGKVLSIDTLMQLLTEINDGDKLSGFFLNIVRAQIPEDAKSQILDPYISEDDNQLRVVVRILETNKDLQRNKLIAEISDFIEKDLGYKPGSFNVTGMFVLYNNMLQSLFDSQIKTILAVFFMILIMFMIIFRSLHLSILALLPNILPSLFILGIMGSLGIPLDLMTITISAIAIGIGVDNAIHYIHRFKSEFAKDSDYLATMHRSHNSIGLAMFYTSITVTLGFLILALSNFIPSIYFGVFTAIAMISAVLANLTLLPHLILLTKPKITT
jgi:predicted RND superfamily exporter protein